MDVRGTGMVADAVIEGKLEVIGLITDEPYADAAAGLIGILKKRGRRARSRLGRPAIDDGD